MKAVLLAPEFAATDGGIQRILRLYLTALANDPAHTSIELIALNDTAEQLARHPVTAARQILDKPLAVTGCSGSKTAFTRAAWRAGRGARRLVCGHIGQLPVAVLAARSGCTLALVAHGIEVWEKQPWYKIIKLRYCDLILPVSAFTGDVMVKKHGIDPAKMQVLNNCLDPNLPIWIKTDKDPQLLKRYGFSESDQIIFTLTRLSAGEKYKGYDKVIEAMESLVKNNPQLKYLIAGKYDTEEKSRLDKLIAVKKLGDHIVFAGFVPDDELAAHFNLATLYVMPSRKEGFGIVFIEAMHYGLPVIAGNQDGSVDALAYGEFGLLVDPTDSAAISQAIEKVLNHLFNYQPNHNALMKRFGYGRYKERLKEMVGG